MCVWGGGCTGSLCLCKQQNNLSSLPGTYSGGRQTLPPHSQMSTPTSEWGYCTIGTVGQYHLSPHHLWGSSSKCVARTCGYREGCVSERQGGEGGESAPVLKKIYPLLTSIQKRVPFPQHNFLRHLPFMCRKAELVLPDVPPLVVPQLHIKYGVSFGEGGGGRQAAPSSHI
jgi:hypothetical protein